MNDSDAVTALSRVSKADEPHWVRHYFYLPSENAASSLATELRDQQFETTTRLAANGDGWLVLARHSIVPSSDLLLILRNKLVEMAQTHGGEYDGWEAEVVH